MFTRIEASINDRCKLVKEAPVIVGVSGGPDSLCLMEVLRRGGYRIIAAYFDHKLRPESRDEAVALKELSRKKDIQFFTGASDVAGYSRERHLSIEEAGRIQRYRFLFDVARRHGAQAVAVGHTADDQVETVLWHLIRGAGLSGLRGMSPRTFLKQFDERIPVVRPLLEVWRSETVAFCEANNLKPLYDRSNQSHDFMRNKIRLQLIPMLETYNPKFREVIYRMAQTLGDDEKLLSERVTTAWQECVETASENAVIFRATCLREYPPGLQRNLIRHAIQSMDPLQEISYAALDVVINFIGNWSDKSGNPTAIKPGGLDLIGGFRFIREYERFVLVKENDHFLKDQWPQLRETSVSEEIRIPCELGLAGSWIFKSAQKPVTDDVRLIVIKNPDRYQAWLDADWLPKDLQLRGRRHGDRIQPLGLEAGTQKLSDFMVNEKIPIHARKNWPLVCSGGQVVWVPGFRIAHPFRLTEASNQAVLFSVYQQE